MAEEVPTYMRIRNYLNTNGIKISHIVRNTNVKSLYSKLNGQTRIFVNDIQEIAGTLGVEPQEFFKDTSEVTK